MKNNVKQKVLKAAVWLVAVIALATVFLIAGFSFLSKPVTSEAGAMELSVRVSSGQSIASVAKELKQKSLIRSDKALYFAARFNLFDKGNDFVLKSGVYKIKSSMSLKEIYMLLQSGKQEYITVSIPEGLTMRKIASLLAESGVCSKEQFLACCTDPELLAEYSIPAQSFEGYLFPDTYFFTPDMPAKDVVYTLVETFFKRVQVIPVKNAPITPEQLHEIVILASIVEREYRVKEEASLIASVFTNRIKHGIGLYSCATIEYIITEINGQPHPDKITYDDLKIDSPYNTYMWAGLTPGPISNPGIIALSAAANPSDTNYYYFVLTDPVAGTHTFSTNFDQHKAAENIQYFSK